MVNEFELDVHSCKKREEKKVVFTDTVEERLNINCALTISKDIFVMGCDEGLYSHKKSQKVNEKVRIEGTKQVYQIESLPSSNIVVFVEG